VGRGWPLGRSARALNHPPELLGILLKHVSFLRDRAPASSPRHAGIAGN
jgi:hypothetical protein